MKHLYICFFFCFIVFSTSCEPELGFNFVDIKKPEKVMVNVKLDALIINDTICLYQTNNNIKYSIDTFGRDILKATFSMGDKYWECLSPEGNINIYSDSFEDGIYKLKCEFILKSHTGSIADQMNGEVYAGILEWDVIMRHEKGPEKKSLATNINKEGYLCISWEKPYYKFHQFKNYTIYYNDELLATINDPNNTTIVNKKHICDYGNSYMVYANFENDVQWHLGYKNFPSTGITINIEPCTTAYDSLTFSWHNKYKCKWNVYVYDELILKETESTSINVKGLIYGSRNPYMENKVRVDLVHFDKSFGSEVVHSTNSYITSIGKYIGYNWMRFGYNPTENVLYYSSYYEISSMLLPQLTPLDTITHDVYNIDHYSCSEINGLFLASNRNTTYIFNNKNFDYKTYPGHNFIILNNDRMFHLDTSTNPYTGILVNPQTKEIEKKVQIQSNSEYWSQWTISQDGRYLCLTSAQSLQLFEFSANFNIINKWEYTGNYNPVRFVPQNSSQIIVGENDTKGKRFSLRSTDDFSIIHHYEFDNPRWVNIDPETGYTCISNQNYLEIQDNNGLVKFNMPINCVNEPFLFNGVLISSDGYALDINKEIN